MPGDALNAFTSIPNNCKSSRTVLKIRFAHFPARCLCKLAVIEGKRACRCSCQQEKQDSNKNVVLLTLRCMWMCLLLASRAILDGCPRALPPLQGEYRSLGIRRWKRALGDKDADFRLYRVKSLSSDKKGVPPIGAFLSLKRECCCSEHSL